MIQIRKVTREVSGKKKCINKALANVSLLFVCGSTALRKSWKNQPYVPFSKGIQPIQQ